MQLRKNTSGAIITVALVVTAMTAAIIIVETSGSLTKINLIKGSKKEKDNLGECMGGKTMTMTRMTTKN